jgi:fructan beta-fructosidase
MFANNGEIVMTDQIFPDPSSTGLEPYMNNGEAKVISLTVHPLKSIYSLVTV